MTLRNAFFVLFFAVFLAPVTAHSAQSQAQEEVRTIHLTEHNGYFAAEETLGGLKPGRYKFVVTNEAGKVVGFQVQHMESHKNLTSFPLEPGETKSTTVRVTEAGVRYRCPINPTPWYNLDNIKTD